MMNNRFGLSQDGLTIDDLIKKGEVSKQLANKASNDHEDQNEVELNINQRVNPYYKPIGNVEVEKPYLKHLKGSVDEELELKNRILNLAKTDKKLLLYIWNHLGPYSEQKLYSINVGFKTLLEALGCTRSQYYRSYNNLISCKILADIKSNTPHGKRAFSFTLRGFNILSELLKTSAIKNNLDEEDKPLSFDILASIIPENLKAKGCSPSWLSKQLEIATNNGYNVDTDKIERTLTNFGIDLQEHNIKSTSSRGPLGLLRYCIVNDVEYNPKFDHNEYPEFDEYLNEFIDNQKQQIEKKLQIQVVLITLQWKDFLVNLSVSDIYRIAPVDDHLIGSLRTMAQRSQLFSYFLENKLKDVTVGDTTHYLRTISREYVYSQKIAETPILNEHDIKNISDIPQELDSTLPNEKCEELWMTLEPILDNGNQSEAINYIKNMSLSVSESEFIIDKIKKNSYSNNDEDLLMKAIKKSEKSSFTLNSHF